MEKPSGYGCEHIVGRHVIAIIEAIIVRKDKGEGGESFIKFSEDDDDGSLISVSYILNDTNGKLENVSIKSFSRFLHRRTSEHVSENVRKLEKTLQNVQKNRKLALMSCQR